MTRGTTQEDVASARSRRAACRCASTARSIRQRSISARNAPPLVHELAPRIMRTALEGTSIKTGDQENADRAMACFVVCCSHLAAIVDDNYRHSIIAGLSEHARPIVDGGLVSLREVADIAETRGESPTELVEAAVQAGLGEKIPPDSTEH
jgi:hypothetical protein